jgi:NAD(P)-dependent dehydrogenase (short-subunit alcohol dehydrogenase family)
MTTQKKPLQQVWFITGASSGFGRAFAELALYEGHSVALTARNSARLHELVASAPERALAIGLDVNDRQAVGRAAAQTLERFGRVDVVINNAGYGTIGAVEETPEHELRAQMETNFFGAVSVIQAFLPALRAQRSGAIVNISSMGGQMSFAGAGAYSASKFALEGISEALAQEMKAFGVKVLVVEPGAFRTDFNGSALRQMPVIDAYSDIVGPVRNVLKAAHHAQEGDPHKAARAVLRAIEDPQTPLRLQLGADAVDAIRAHAQTLLADLEKWEAAALDTRIAAHE